MAENVSDIEIAVNAAGTEQTRQEIEETTGALEESGDEMADTADDMSGLQRKMQGLGLALAGTLAAASAGLLSQVPVIGESFAGLKAVIDGVAFQMDKVLRPVLGPVSNLFFDLSEAVFAADGAVGRLVGTLSVLGTLGIIGTVAAIATGVISLSGVVGGAASAVTILTSSFVSFLVFTNPVIIAVGALTIALGALAFMFRDELPTSINEAITDLTNFKNTLTSVGSDVFSQGAKIATALANGIASGALTVGLGVFKLVQTITMGIAHAVAQTGSAGADIVSNIVAGITSNLPNVDLPISNLTNRLSGPIQSVVSGATDMGKDFVSNIADGITSNLQKVKNAGEKVAGILDKHMPNSPADTGPLSDLDKSGPAFVETVAQGIESNVGRMADASNQAAEATSQSDTTEFFSGSTSPTVQPQMDGRDLTERTGRYRRDGTARRNRNG